MRFEIDSSSVSFDGEGLKNFFESINHVCEKYQVNYFVVGAFARDIILENIFHEKGGVATKDIDIAIQLKSWDEYKLVSEELLANYNFKKGEIVHEYISPDGIISDIIPYGGLESNRSVVFPGHTREINMMGFQEVESGVLNIVFDGEVPTKVASIEGIVILKMIAWKDRQPAQISEKHVRDISLVIDTYYLAKVSEFAVEFSDILDVDVFDEGMVGARALGRRMKQLCGQHEELIREVNSIFELILQDAENSLFIRQFAGAKNRSFAYSYEVVKALQLGFDEL